MTINWTEASTAVEAGETFLVVSHVSPDGDAVGSLLAVANMLRARGKTVDAVLDDGVPDYLRFVPGAETVKQSVSGGKWDVMIAVDASDEPRCGKVGAYGLAHSGTIINLDHHPTNTMFGDIHLVDPYAVSATEVIFYWLKDMGFKWVPDVVKPLLVGLVTDTLGFRTSNVKPDTLSIAQELMEAGASLTEVTERALDTRSYQTVKLWKRSLPNVEMHDDGVISAAISWDDYKAVGLTDLTDGGLVGFLVRVNEAMIAVVFEEGPDKFVKLSMRSKPGFDISGVALSLGGGGHKQACGATVPGTLDEVKARVIPMLQAVAREGTLAIV